MFYNFGEYNLVCYKKSAFSFQWQNSVLEVDYNFVEY